MKSDLARLVSGEPIKSIVRPRRHQEGPRPQAQPQEALQGQEVRCQEDHPRRQEGEGRQGQGGVPLPDRSPARLVFNHMNVISLDDASVFFFPALTRKNTSWSVIVTAFLCLVSFVEVVLWSRELLIPEVEIDSEKKLLFVEAQNQFASRHK